METLFAISLDEHWQLSIQIGWKFYAFVIAIFVLAVFHNGIFGMLFSKDIEIDGADIGIGSGTVKLKKNDTDRQIAFKIWVELKTRKIGLPIDLEKDVISEVYDSWYTFFGITRELLKDIPISKIKKKHTQAIVNLSIDVLNCGIRPHLTSWQAKYRRWYEAEEKSHPSEAPQDIQKRYEHYNELVDDMLIVNQQLIAYRDNLRDLVMG